MKLNKKTLLFFFVLCQVLLAQTKTNLELINQLVDSSSSQIVENLTELNSKYQLNISSPKEFHELKHRILNSFAINKIKIDLDSATANKINYSLSKVSVQYTDLFKDGLFGDYLLKRKIFLSGDYSIQKSSEILAADIFNYTLTDTISYDKYSLAENNSLPFTKGNIPDAPFFPSILEPVVAITTVVVSVILFFSVRTK
ncbi:MAG: hypothetical protein KKF62_18840 [Bacteroidetes bacterium]|nr:hypothetical protein [Bacteroidota bacterium]MBU1116877.1 hypothetical protein [Bacteroidota bacterium]MBU1797445.1 hypothetical protein [Bacteroidota bacterium]